MTNTFFYLGLDAGGTKTELRAGRSLEDLTVTLKGPAANLNRQGLEATARVLGDLIREANSKHPGEKLHAVCAGIAGAGIPADQRAIAEALLAYLAHEAPDHCIILPDAAIALEGAFNGGSGVIVVAGTGSVVYARTTDGQVMRAGGWGYLLGDEGSGHALGILGLRAVTHAFDGGPETRLQAMLAKRFGLATAADLVHHVYREGFSVQKVAPLLLDAAAAQDAVAVQILRDQTEKLAQQVQWLALRSEHIAPRLAVLGGLSRSAVYRKALSTALRHTLPGWLLQKPAHDPAFGALRLALAVQP